MIFSSVTLVLIAFCNVLFAYLYNSDLSLQFTSDIAITSLPYQLVVFVFLFFFSLRTDRGDFLVVCLNAASMFLFVPLVVLTFALAYGMCLDVPSDDLSSICGQPFLEKEERVYFSLVTFTTLGYGDISPTGFGRMLAAWQGFIGFFLTPVLFIELSAVLAAVYRNSHS